MQLITNGCGHISKLENKLVANHQGATITDPVEKENDLLD